MASWIDLVAFGVRVVFAIEMSAAGQVADHVATYPAAQPEEGVMETMIVLGLVAAVVFWMLTPKSGGRHSHRGGGCRCRRR